MIKQVKIIKFRPLKNIDNSKFREDVAALLDNLATEDVFFLKVDRYNSILNNILSDHAPLQTKKIKDVVSSPWFDSEYAKLRKQRRNAEKRYRRTGKEEDKRAYINLRKQTIKVSIIKKKQYVGRKLGGKNSSRSLYSVVGQLIDKRKTMMLPSDNSDEDLANKFNTFFNQKIELIRAKFSPSPDQCQPIPFSGDPKLTCFKPTDATELAEIIKAHPLKCSSDDPVPAVILSSNLDLFIPYWVEMVNLSLSVGSMDSLKTGILTPLIKELNSNTNVEILKN